jgi:hypothetical protein
VLFMPYTANSILSLRHDGPRRWQHWRQCLFRRRFFDDGTESRQLPESVLYGVQWKIFTDIASTDETARKTAEEKKRSEEFATSVAALKVDPRCRSPTNRSGRAVQQTGGHQSSPRVQSCVPRREVLCKRQRLQLSHGRVDRWADKRLRRRDHEEVFRRLLRRDGRSLPPQRDAVDCGVRRRAVPQRRA